MSTVTTDDEAKRNIAENVNRLMAARDLSQADLSRASGESEMRVSLLRRGLKMPTAGFLARIAEALGVSVDTLLSPPTKTPNSRKSRKTA
jgi:transcriptional regulator with XRE-family HTH domain